jgi:hypothetical protein
MEEKITRHSMDGKWSVVRPSRIDAVAGLNGYTLRLQKRPVLEYLYRAIVAHRAGLPAPQLLGQAGD